MSPTNRNPAIAPAPDTMGGGIEVEALVATAREDVCTLPMGNQTDAHRFASAVLNYLRHWMERRSADDPLRSGFVAFVLSGDLSNEGDRLGAGMTQHFFNTRLDNSLGGNLLLSTASGRTVRTLALASQEFGDVVDEVTEWDSNGLPPMGERAAVLANLANGMAYVCYAGTHAREPDGDLSAVPFDLLAPRTVVDALAVIRFLEHAHDVCLATPQRGLAAVWDDPTQGVPVKEAEQTIQAILRVMAEYTFKTCRVAGEPSMGDSRADVLIYPVVEGIGERTLIELKVLREKHWNKIPANATKCRPSVNRNAVIKGIDQAREYTEIFAMKNALLCVYDMRKHDDPALTDSLGTTADRLDVKMLRYYLYRSSEHRRQSRPDSAYNELSSRSDEAN